MPVFTDEQVVNILFTIFYLRHYKDTNIIAYEQIN